MKKINYIVIGLIIAIFLLVLPLIFNYGLSPQYVSNSSLDKFNNYNGVTLSYYAAIFGGFVGGIFTYAGVKLSLDNQEYLMKKEAESHKKLLLFQLNYTYKAIDALSGLPVHNNILLPAIVFDNNWHTHLPYISCLDQKDLENIANWFSALQDLEHLAQFSETGEVPIFSAIECTEPPMEYIKEIIDKIESDPTC